MTEPIRISADIDREDRLLAGLTARQLAIVAAAAVLALLVATAARQVVPLPLAAVLACPIALAGLVLALGRLYGLSGDRLLRAALRHALSPRRLIPAPEGIASLPRWAATTAPRPPGALELPAHGLLSSGVVDLGADGAALVCRATTVNFGLRAEPEQEALLEAFARFLHSLTAAPVQILVRTDRADLRGLIGELEQAAGGLPHPALEAAARDHAHFLEALAARRDVLRPELLVVFREPAVTAQAARVLARRVEQAATLLAAVGVALTPLDQDQAADVLARAADPGGAARPAGLAASGETITRRSP
jgi:hypothetical protein